MLSSSRAAGAGHQPTRPPPPSPAPATSPTGHHHPPPHPAAAHRNLPPFTRTVRPRLLAIDSDGGWLSSWTQVLASLPPLPRRASHPQSDNFFPRIHHSRRYILLGSATTPETRTRGGTPSLAWSARSGTTPSKIGKYHPASHDQVQLFAGGFQFSFSVSDFLFGWGVWWGRNFISRYYFEFCSYVVTVV